MFQVLEADALLQSQVELTLVPHGNGLLPSLLSSRPAHETPPPHPQGDLPSQPNPLRPVTGLDFLPPPFPST
jgi:hypothetical protein